MSRRPGTGEEGMALVLVLVLIALLSAFLIDQTYSSVVDLRLAETFRDRTRAYYLARGGLEAGRAILANDRNRYDGGDELWAIGVPGYAVGDDGNVSLRIEDEDGRLNLNRLVEARGNALASQKNRIRRLFGILGFTDVDGKVDALQDWIDPDDIPQPAGVEDRYYLSLEHPYRCKNAPLDHLDELLMIKGFDAATVDRLRPHVAVHGGPLVNNLSLVNINTASREVLMSLHNDMGEVEADTLIASRDAEPLRDKSQMKDLPGLNSIYLSISNQIAVTSTTYRLLSEGQVGDGRRRIEAVVQKSGDRLLYLRVD